MVTPNTIPSGACVALVLPCLWLCVCRPPRRFLRVLLLLGTVALLPYFALAALLPGGAGLVDSQQPALVVLASLLVRSLGGLVVSLATIATLTPSDLRLALAPLPTTLSAILLQIVHQTAFLAYETHRIASAMSVRAASVGVATAWKLVASLPQVWLPRIVQRADRVSFAMELRGYCDFEHQSSESPRLRRADWVALVAAASALGLSIGARLGSLR
jgi:energy-coupling factor transporter transmembrane protein EcfT